LNNTNIALRFIYDGYVRHVDSVTIEKDTVIGFEMRKNGKFSFKVKRYSMGKMEKVKRIPSYDR